MATPEKTEILLVLTPWEPPAEFVSALSTFGPNIQVESRVVPYYSTDFPKDIPAEILEKVTILFTWKTFPPKHLVPNLAYVQLLSAGCNQIMGLDLFEETDIAFCTANGVHPPQITEWVFSTFFAFQHHIPQYLKYQAQNKWVLPESDEDTEDAVGLRV
jgi:phosphoglycerate dehydrogenase-like enzyme